MNDQKPSDQALLEALVMDRDGLPLLESVAGQFNVFEALGVVRQELRHSDFLAFLLDPRRNHGLGDSFAKRLLQHVSANATGRHRPDGRVIPVTPVDFDVWSLDELSVRREWHHIDLLLEDANHQLVVAIENKVDSGEHSDQLGRGWREIEEHHPGWKVMGLFLTADGAEPSDARYLPVDYGLVCQVLDELRTSRSPGMGNDLQTIILHYTQILRRHFMADSDVAALCQALYLKHRAAFDLVFEHRPDTQATVRRISEKLIGHTTGLDLDICGKGAVRFYADEWDIPVLNLGAGWTSTGRILLFEITNTTSHVRLGLYIGPGPDNIRTALFDAALKLGPPLKPQRKKVMGKWNQVYSKELLSQSFLEDNAASELLESTLTLRWQAFAEGDLLKIRELLSSILPNLTEPHV